MLLCAVEAGFSLFFLCLRVEYSFLFSLMFLRDMLIQIEITLTAMVVVLLEALCCRLAAIAVSSLTAGGGRRSTQEHTHHVLLQAPNPFPPPRLHRAPLAVPIPTETCQQTGYIVLEWMTTAAYGFGGFGLASAVYWANLGLWQQWDNIRVATWQDGAGLGRSHVRAAAVTQAQDGGGMCGVACASERGTTGTLGS